MKSTTLLTVRGFSTLEIMIALMIITSTLAATMLVAQAIPDTIANGHQRKIAEEYANDALQEELRIGMISFSQIGNVATTTTNSFETGLSATLLPDGLSKELTSTTQWVNLRGKVSSVSISAIVSNFGHPSPAGICDPVLMGDWVHPKITTQYFKPGSLLPATYPESNPLLQALAISSSTLIATAGTSVHKTDPTLFLFDISSSTKPVYLSSLDNSSSTITGIAAATMSGNTLYAANAVEPNFYSCKTRSSCSQLQLIDASDLLKPKLVTSFQLPTTTGAYATGSGGQAAGKSIFYSDGIVYLGIQKTDSPFGTEFNTIDVRDPAHPHWLGGYHVGRTVNHIEIRGTYAYVATDDPSRELLILDVEDPKNPTLISSFDAPGTSAFGFGETLSLQNPRNLDAETGILLGRSYIPGGAGLLVLNSDFSSQSHTNFATRSVGVAKEDASVQGIIFRQFLAFVLTSHKLELWNMWKSNLTLPTPYTTPIFLPQGTTAGLNGLACRHEMIYVVSTNSVNLSTLMLVTGS